MADETMGTALRLIDRLFAGGGVAGLSDAQLLDRFVARRDPEAFEALVARHGPMVLSVCRGILRDPDDAEDAFQASFLVLVKKADTLRNQHALGGWLYQVAHRVAIRANAAAARRREYERRAGQMASTTTSGPADRDDSLRALHEAIARLPEKLRLAVVLCDLKGLSQDRAAEELRLSERTLRRRLSEGRERLKSGLSRRGLAGEGGALSAAFLRESRAAIPSGWGDSTLRAALATLDPTTANGAVSAAAATLTREVLRMMIFQKFKLVSAALLSAGLVGWGASAALVPLAQEPSKTPAPAESPPERRQVAAAASPKALPGMPDVVGTFPVRGRVLDPDGKPVANAEIYLRHVYHSSRFSEEPAPSQSSGRVTACDADGRFRFDLDKASSNWPPDSNGVPPWHKAEVAAMAPGFGLAWVDVGSLMGGGEADLRLVRDDVPIRGRVLDTQGHPLAGASIRLARVASVKAGVDLDKLMASDEFWDEVATYWDGGFDTGAIWAGGRNTWTSDADGRFEIRGIGRDRLAELNFHGPTLANVTIYAMTHAAKVPPKPRRRPKQVPVSMRLNASYGPPPVPPLVGATFEQVVGPTKPIIGVVRSKETGKPLAGIHVGGSETATWTQASTTTDAEGRFRLVGLPKGEVYQVGAYPRSELAPYLGDSAMVTDTEGLAPIETNFELPKRADVLVIGRLVDAETGLPVWANSDVRYYKLPSNKNEGKGGSSVELSQTDPTFRMTVPPGEGMFTASARGPDAPYTRARLSKADKGKGVGGEGDGEADTANLNSYHVCKIFDIPNTGKPVSIELKVTRGLSRKGRVVDPDGRPVIGARCYGLLSTWGHLKTLEGDTFEVLGLEPEHPRQLIFAHEGRRLVGSIMIAGDAARDSTPLEVRLVPAGTVKGRIVDEDGTPLPDAKLWVMSYGLDGTNLPFPRRDSLWPDGGFRESSPYATDAEGRFQIVGLKPGIKSMIGVEKRSRPNHELEAPKILRNLILERPGEVRDLGDLTVKDAPDR